ncbi:hypothetical protein LTR99_005733 [Exophiala xenobiotica]|uniref:Myb-like DNA-binding domain-containing protein n=1 Tax=Vermiconidia calcicola TaxID=1690605 RepID=A0AAV9QGH3_9PEZI|nr:hypothetical protein LTR99_005733 [Exophiala xenobiotica]KAK5541193.1 hypothetical protein LTR25_002970 [Vermiconidia calcicola]KAK5549314.1 hypothetical protein LTR23_000422 [Chaetothyriales sp. CCFEE 6169]KAK5340470.1 hypothetical protein LTR98_003592 [Exophiala xenobiotica]KAK5430968.1 hypothetical protein LTR34_005527 [Exophiala xenobiotica]
MSKNLKNTRKATPEDQIRFLISCCKHSNFGRVDHVAVARECGITSKGASAKRYERVCKAYSTQTCVGPDEDEDEDHDDDIPMASFARKRKTADVEDAVKPAKKSCRTAQEGPAPTCRASETERFGTVPASPRDRVLRLEQGQLPQEASRQRHVAPGSAPSPWLQRPGPVIPPPLPDPAGMQPRMAFPTPFPLPVQGYAHPGSLMHVRTPFPGYMSVANGAGPHIPDGMRMLCQVAASPDDPVALSVRNEFDQNVTFNQYAGPSYPFRMSMQQGPVRALENEDLRQQQRLPPQPQEVRPLLQGEKAPVSSITKEQEMSSGIVVVE